VGKEERGAKTCEKKMKTGGEPRNYKLGVIRNEYHMKELQD